MTEIVQSFPVPSDVVGFVIGRGGHALQAIERGTGAQLKFQNDEKHDFGMTFKYLHMRGLPRQIDRAKRLVMRRLHDVWTIRRQEASETLFDIFMLERCEKIS